MATTQERRESRGRRREATQGPVRLRRIEQGSEERGLWSTLTDLAGAFQPMVVKRLSDEISARLEEVPAELNDYGFDRYGFHPETFRRGSLPGALLYRHYFRVATPDTDRVPAAPDSRS